MSEALPTDLSRPLSNDETRRIPADPQCGNYSYYLRRLENSSGVYLLGDEEELGKLYTKFGNPEAYDGDSSEKATAWENLYGALWTTGKVEVIKNKNNSQPYTLYIRANAEAATADFQAEVLKPLAKFQIIPQSVVSAFD